MERQSREAEVRRVASLWSRQEQVLEPEEGVLSPGQILTGSEATEDRLVVRGGTVRRPAACAASSTYST